MGIRVMSSYSYDGEYMGTDHPQVRLRGGQGIEQSQSDPCPARICAVLWKTAGPWRSLSMARVVRDTK